MKAQESGQNKKHTNRQNAQAVTSGGFLLNSAMAEPIMANRVPQAQRKCACGGQCPACSASHGIRRSISHLSVPPVLQGNGVSSTGGNAFVQQLRNIAAPRHREKVNQHTLPQLWSRMGMGSRIPQSQRAPFENSYGYDFSGVRLHRGSMADKFTRALGVPAVSLGPHIILNRQVDSLPTERSRHVLGHELAHIGQRAAMPAQSLSPAAYRDISISPFNSRSEMEASAASRAAMLGQAYDLNAPLAEDIAPFPWLLLGAALLITAGVAALAPSTEDNARRAAEDPTMHINSGWVFVPGYGSLVQVWQARSGLERGLGMLFLALDIVTLGMAGAAILRLSSAGIQSLRAAGSGVSRELAQAGMRPLEEAAAHEMVMNELRAGRAIVGAEGALNHSVIYVMNSEGRIVRIHGGISRLLYPTQEFAEEGFRMSLNAFTVVEQSTARMGILEAEQMVRQGGATMLRSCAATQCLLLERAGVEGLEALVPRNYAGRYIPASVIGHQATHGVVQVVNLPRLLTGTVIHESLLLGGTSGVHAAGTLNVVVTIPGATVPFLGTVPTPLTPGPRGAGGSSTGSSGTGRREVSDDLMRRARLIVERYGTNPQGAVLQNMLAGAQEVMGPYNLQDSGVQTDMLYALEYAGMQAEPRELLIRRWAGIRTP